MKIATTKRAFCLRIVLALIFCIFFLQATFSEPAITVGGSCDGSEGTYLWLTSSRTAWSLADIYAVPVGTLDPQQWSQSGAFHTRLQEVLPSDPQANDYASAAASIWGEFFTNQADILVSIKRNLSATKRNVECISGVWTVTSTIEETSPDISGWLQVGGDYDVASDAQLLNSELQNKVNELNEQPGANTTPFDTFVLQEQ